MREFDFKEFYNNIQKDFSEAYKFIAYIEREEYFPALYNHDVDVNYYDEELEYNKERLINKFELIKLKFDFTYEFLNLNKLANRLDAELKEYGGKFDQLKMVSFADDFHSPVLAIFARHLNALTSHINVSDENKYATINLFSLLEQILTGTPKMLTDRNIEPSNEAEVRTEVYNTFIHVFPDTVREIPISKVSKVYKPDIGVRSLKSAIEYKFVSTKEEAKVAIGGIFEDINGYEGSNDWTTFYAVIYMTDNFMTQHQVEAEFKLSKVPHNWKPIVVFGKGGRKNNSKTKNAKTAKDAKPKESIQ